MAGTSSKKPDPYIGRVLDGRFTLLARIGRGGMGLVYRARQSPLDRNVALKVLVGSGKSDREAEFQRRFFREAATAAKLKHPNTITVFDYGSDELEGERVFWIAMELLEGQTLSRALSKGALDPSRVIWVALQMCRSLREAHKAGIVHRDLKPGNVMLMQHDNEDGQETEFVKVLDFGLAKTFQGAGEPALTRAGTFLGSPRYVAPEQIEGRPVDPRTDIYSFGCVLYRMLTGVVPYDGSSPVEIMMKHLNESPPDITDPEVPDDLVALCLSCLEKRADKRPQSMQDLITQLKRIRAQLGLSTSWEEVSDVAPLPAAAAAPAAEATSAPAPEISDPARRSKQTKPEDVWADDDEEDDARTAAPEAEVVHPDDDEEPTGDLRPRRPLPAPARSDPSWVGQVPLDDTRPSNTIPQSRAAGLVAWGLFLGIVCGALGLAFIGRELGWFDALRLPEWLAPLLQRGASGPVSVP